MLERNEKGRPYCCTYLCRINCAAKGPALLLYVVTIILLFLYIIAIASRKRAGRVAVLNIIIIYCPFF